MTFRYTDDVTCINFLVANNRTNAIATKFCSIYKVTFPP